MEAVMYGPALDVEVPAVSRGKAASNHYPDDVRAAYVQAMSERVFVAIDGVWQERGEATRAAQRLKVELERDGHGPLRTRTWPSGQGWHAAIGPRD